MSKYYICIILSSILSSLFLIIYGVRHDNFEVGFVGFITMYISMQVEVIRRNDRR